MAYDWRNGASYLSDVLMGLGTGLLTAPRGGPPLAGLGMGIQNANQLAAQRTQQQRDKLRDDLIKAQLTQQQEADAEKKRQIAAQRTAFAQLLPPVVNQSGFRPTGAGPGASSAVSQTAPVNPLLSGMTPEQIAFLRAYGSADAGGALSMIGERAFQQPDTPKTQTFYEGNSQYEGYIDPSTKQIVRLTQNAPRWQPPQAPQLPADVQEYLFAKKQDPSIGTYAQWKKSQSSGDLRYGLNPVYGQDENGRTVLLLPNNQGGITKVQTPDGVTISPQTQIFDTGTAGIPIDRRTGQPVPGAAPIQKDVAGQQSLQEQGTAQGKVAAGLPDTLAGADLALKTIEDLKADPARTAATGMSSVVMNKIPGTPAYDYAQKVAQAKGQVFRQVYEGLRGGGAITEIESSKAEQALSRLDTAQTEDGFMRALNDLEEVIKAGSERARQKASAGPQINQVPAAPAVPPPPPGFEVVP